MAVLSTFDLSKLWTRTIGTRGERMVTNINLLYGRTEGGGYKAVANITYLRDNLRAMDISKNLWNSWIENRVSHVPQALIIELGSGELQGWLRLDDSNMRALSRLTDNGSLDDELTAECLIDWEDKAFEAQWNQFTDALLAHILEPFLMLSKAKRYQLAWDAYVYARNRLHHNPVTTFTKAVIAVHLLLPEWIRYAKAKFPYRKRGAVPRIA